MASRARNPRASEVLRTGTKVGNVLNTLNMYRVQAALSGDVTINGLELLLPGDTVRHQLHHATPRDQVPVNLGACLEGEGLVNWLPGKTCKPATRRAFAKFMAFTNDESNWTKSEQLVDVMWPAV